MKRYALLVGVDTYRDPQIRNLSYSVADAFSLNAVFEDLDYQTKVLANPTRLQLITAIRECNNLLRAGDKFFFYFAGHGWTTVGGAHLLFCSDDVYDPNGNLNAGLSFDGLKTETIGNGYDRVFVLDACRNHFREGVRDVVDNTTRNLRPISELLEDGGRQNDVGSLAVIRSCSQNEHAIEIVAEQHGLFTLAMRNVLRAAIRDGQRLFWGTEFCGEIIAEMNGIAARHEIRSNQTPEFAMAGAPQLLFPGNPRSNEAPVYYSCPICGKKNKIEDTFRCRQCGSDNLCLRHQDEKTFLCFNCADAKRESVKTDASSSKISKVGNKIYEGSSSGNEPDSVKITVKVSPELGGEAAVDYDSAQDLYDRAENYYRGQNGVKEDRAKAFELYKKASELGHAESQYSLGYMYAYGECTTKDEEKALFWYRKAAKQGHEKARRMVEGIESRRRPSWGFGSCSAPSPQSMSVKDAYERGENYYYGRNGFGRDYAEAVKWYRKAAVQGYARAQCDLGFMYENGRGVTKKDDYEAVKWYRKAADQGNASAQCNLGFMYENGRGVTKDESAAVKWYRKAADQGHARSQCNLGIMYDYGKGIKQDFFEAIKWYRKAADSGFATAQFAIGLMYDRGRGFQQNYEEAAIWYRKAISNGHEKAKEFLKVIEKIIAEGSRKNLLHHNTAANIVNRVQLWKDGPYWADRNIGAENPWDSGYYFWWGDTVGYKRENDKWVASNGTNSNFSFDNKTTLTHWKSISELQNQGWIVNKNGVNVLTPKHDAAQAHWGGDWRMPSRGDFIDLVNKCDWKRTAVNGVDGFLVQGRGNYSSKSIFFPFAGVGLGAALCLNVIGYIWSSVPFSNDDAWYFHFRSDRLLVTETGRSSGHPVRPLQGFMK